MQANLDERDIIDRINAGDESAFVHMVREYHAGLCDFAVAYAQDDPASVEEIVHDVLLSVWQRRGGLHVEGSLFAYLCGAVRKRAITYSSKARREQRTLEAAVLEQADSIFGAADAALERGEMEDGEPWATLRAAVQKLPPGRRLVLQLRWERQLSFAEIAQVLGVSVRAAETQHMRAMKDLRRAFGVE